MSIKKLVIVNGKRQLIDFNDKPGRSDTDRVYNRRRSEDKSDYLKFYSSRTWQKDRANVLKRDSYLCCRCGLEAKLVDHIIPSELDWDNRLDQDFQQSLCQRCHNLKTRREKIKQLKGSKRYMFIHVVAGLPASGKTTYVKQHMTNHDLIYDYDYLMSAITGLPLHEHNIEAHEYIAMFYEIILRKIKSEKSFDNVWIVTTKPDDRLTTLLAPYTVDYTYIDADVDVIKSRLNKEKRNSIQIDKLKNEIELIKKESFFKQYKVIKS